MRGTRLRMAVVVGGLLVLGVAVAAGWRIVALQQSAVEARDHVGAARAALSEVSRPDSTSAIVDSPRLLSACSEVSAAADALQDINGQLSTLMPLVEVLESVPVLGVQTRGQAATLQAGTQVAAVGVSLCDGLGPLASVLSGGSVLEGPGSASEVLQTLVRARPKLVAARQRLEQLQLSLDAIQLSDLTATNQVELVTLRQRLPKVLSTLHDAMVMLDLMGSQHARRYLLVSQNPDELRGTGGFIGSAGIVETDAGRLRLVEYGSSRRYDTPPELRVIPPEPFQGYLGSFWHIAGANWWTSFPDVARQLDYLFSLSRPDAPLDGVIALDQIGLQRLLEVVGPVDVPEYAERVSAADVEAKLNQYVHVDSDESTRKQFTAALSSAVLQAALHAPRSALPGLVRASRESLDQQHLLFWTSDTDAAQLFAEKRWDGGVLPSTSDALMLVETNVANTKGSQAVRRDAVYAVDVSNNQHLTASLIVNYANQGDRDYRTFLRVLVPSGSTLGGTNGFVDHPTTGQECGRSFFAGEVFIPRAASAQVSLQYQLPASVLASSYDLLVQQQPGIPPGELSVSIKTADGHAAQAMLANVPGSHARWRLESGALQPAALPEARVGGCGQALVEALPIAAPAVLAVPAAHIEAPVVELGVSDSGEMDAPPTPDVVGWYRMSARPGQPGNSVMSGHVDWGRSTAVFWELRNLRPGDPIQVRGADGVTHTYTVQWNRTFVTADAPVDQIVGPTRDAVLTLITCDGAFDQRIRQYSERRVVRAQLSE